MVSEGHSSAITFICQKSYLFIPSYINDPGYWQWCT